MATPGFEEEFLRRLEAAFRLEAAEHVQELSSGLIDLEKSATAEARATGVEHVFREAHSLKGAARAVNRIDVESICQHLEDVFAAWKKGQVEATPELFDALLKSVDGLARILEMSSDETTGLVDTALMQLAVARQARLPGSPDAAVGRAPDAVAARAPDRNIGNDRTNPPQPPAARAATARPSAPTGKAISTQGTAPAEKLPPPDERPRAAPAIPPEVLPPHDAVAVQPARAAVPATANLASSAPAEARLERAGTETVRIALSKLDMLLLEAEEMLAVKLTVRQRSSDLRDIDDVLRAWRKRWAKLQPALRQLRGLGDASGPGQLGPGQMGQAEHRDLIDFLDWNENHLRALEERIVALSKAAAQDQRALSSLVDTLLEDTKQLLMLPFATLLSLLPKLVRDLGRDQGKEIDLQMAGGDVEIDKRILDEMKDPLIHLVRNSIDHGIEDPDLRARRAKPVRASLRVAVAQTSGSEVELMVRDDGGGIDLAQVRQSAVRHGRITQDEADSLDDGAAMDLIFASEVSTSPIITEISGRGLGMAIVREKVEKLGGRIHIESIHGRGTTFRILLPLSVATFRGILVRAGDALFVVPTAHVERIVRVRPADVRTVENRASIVFENRPISLVALHGVLGIPVGRGQAEPPFLTVLVLGGSDRRVAFTVDEVRDEQEVLVKNLGRLLVRVRNVAGATILGTGQVVPILNVSDLLKSATVAGAYAAASANAAAGALSAPAAADRAADSLTRPRQVLVVEDSITSRMLLKNILESAGYIVKTAVDGLDALASFKTETYDLIVSDVDMPRLNGFDLTAQIRAGPRAPEIPVVLVTARGTREDRERGIDVGANAYIVKSSFDQSDLLEIVRRLI